MSINVKVSSEDIFLLKAIDMNNVDLSKSNINDDGTACFYLDVDKMPDMNGKSAREIFNSKVFDAAFNPSYSIGKSNSREHEPNNSVEYYINYDPAPSDGLLNTETFSVRVPAEHLETGYEVGLSDPIGVIVKSLRGEREYKDITEALDKFNTAANKWVSDQKT